MINILSNIFHIDEDYRPVRGGVGARLTGLANHDYLFPSFGEVTCAETTVENKGRGPWRPVAKSHPDEGILRAESLIRLMMSCRRWAGSGCGTHKLKTDTLTYVASRR